MRAVIRLEIVGDNYRQHLRAIESGDAPMPHIKKYIRCLRYGRQELRPWVAKITTNGREFIVGVRDYSMARGLGMFGIYEYFALDPGIYEVNECIKLGVMRHYCIRVDNAQYEEIPCPRINTI